MRWLAAVVVFIAAGCANAQVFYLPHLVTADTDFVSILNAHSDYSSITYPDLYPSLPFDYSSWIKYDVTCECGSDPCVADDLGAGSCTPLSGSAPFPASWNCSPLVQDDSTDDSGDYYCMMQATTTTPYLLYFPDGVYDFTTKNDGNAIWRPVFGKSRRGMKGESRNAIINVNVPTNSGNNDSLYIFWDFEDTVNPNFSGDGTQAGIDAATLTWADATRSKGLQTITVGPGETSALTDTEYDSGNWVLLQTDPLTTDPGKCCQWVSRVTSIDAGNNQFDIQHPIPQNMTGTNPRVYVMDPAMELVIDTITMKVDDSKQDHQNASSQWFVGKNFARFIIYNASFQDGYRQFFTTEPQDQESLNGGANDIFRHSSNADLYIMHSDFEDSRSDKATNQYLGVMGGIQRGWLHDSSFESGQGLALHSGGNNILVSFSEFLGMDPETRVDTSPHDGCEDGSGGLVAVADQLCDENWLDGGNNDCRVCQTAHSAVHGVTSTNATYGDAYTHCNYNTGAVDQLGGSGDTSCKGAPSGKVYSSLQWHNEATSNSLILRNYFEGGTWFADGSGFNNIIFHGNFWADSARAGTAEFNSTPTGFGKHAFRDESDNANKQPNWTHNTIYAGGVYEGAASAMGTSVGPFDVYGDGVKVLDNAIERSGTTACYYESSVTISQCTQTTTSMRDGVNTTWSRNTTGSATYAEGATIPSAPGTGWTSWDDVPFLSTPTGYDPPYVGIEVGDTPRPCLPARYRREGSC